MRLIRKFAVQGHAVPQGAHAPNGPFPPEIMEEPRGNYTEEHADSMHEAYDNMRLFRCRDCAEILYKEHLHEHECEE